MKIAILGTRGIPNNYGGFEQFAEYLSVGLVNRGHDVTVYNPHFHPYLETFFMGVKIKRMLSPENIFGSAANYIYDYLCLRDALKEGFDLVYEAGYGSASFSYLFLPIKRTCVITNMDGLEWRRTKWNAVIKYLTRKAEYVAIKKSHYIISDNVGIQRYYRLVFKRESKYLPYGATPIYNFQEALLNTWNLKAKAYYLVIARLEPENNLETIIQGFIDADVKEKLIIVGNTNSRYSNHLIDLCRNDKSVRFLGGIYDKVLLDSLRHYSKGYIHGHSVGGTNPSLLEAMACATNVIAHRNIFNQSVLGENALYFSTPKDFTEILVNFDRINSKMLGDFQSNNMKRINTYYNWENVVDMHQDYFHSILQDSTKTYK
jgi:glycosyltransferase involved in cell wall biosynthesis